MTTTEERIMQYMANKGCTRLEAIAALELGEQSEAAKRVIAKRVIRLKM